MRTTGVSRSAEFVLTCKRVGYGIVTGRTRASHIRSYNGGPEPPSTIGPSPLASTGRRCDYRARQPRPHGACTRP